MRRVVVLALSLLLVVPASGVPTAVAATPLAFGFNYNPLPQDGAPGAGVRWLSGATAAPLQTAVRPGSIHRFGIQWSEVEYSAGQYSFTSIDERIGPLADAGLKLLPIPFNSPSFHRNFLENLACAAIPDCRIPPADTVAKRAAWQEFVRQLTLHFSTGRYAGALAGIEVWNEPNYNNYWRTPAGPDPARYARLLCSAHAGVTSVDSAIPVVVGGLVPWDGVLDGDYPSNGNGMPMAEFLGGVYGAPGVDARQCMDAVAVHNYVHGIPPDAPGLNSYLDPLTMLRNAFQANGDSGRRIWMTEVGIPVAVGEPVQAERGVCAFQIAVAQADVDVFIWHTLADFPAHGTFGTMGAYGFDAAGNPTPRLLRDWLRDLFLTYGGAVPGVSQCDQAWRPPGQ